MTTSQRVQEANLFNVIGPVTISYSRDSIAAVPQLSYKDAEVDLSFIGTEIAREDTPLGEIVTVTLEIVVDVLVRTYAFGAEDQGPHR